MFDSINGISTAIHYFHNYCDSVGVNDFKFAVRISMLIENDFVKFKFKKLKYPQCA